MMTLPLNVLGKAGLLSLLFATNIVAGDWTTFGHDPQRSGWANEENKLTRENVPHLVLRWRVQVKNRSFSLSALTAPVVATGVPYESGIRSIVYVAGTGGSVFASDAETGELLWDRTFKLAVSPKNGGFQGTFLCPGGITATPVIDIALKIIYVVAPDGALYGLDLGTGKVRYGPVQFVASFSKNWSLNFAGGTVYTVLSQGCGNGLSGFYAVDVSDRHHPLVRQMLLSNTNTAGIWGRGGPIIGKDGRIYGATADGKFDVGLGDYSNSIVAVAQKDLSLADYFVPTNWVYLSKRDFDLGSTSPVWFHWRDRDLLADGSKEGILFLMDAKALGGEDHHTPLFTSAKLGNETMVCCEGTGIWGGLSTARDNQGETWLYVPMGGPPAAHSPAFPISNGANPHGSIMAFKVAMDAKTENPVLQPAWISGDFDLPDPVVIANGVVFGLSTGENAVQRGGEEKRLLNTHAAVLKALDASTGKELYSSGKSISGWVHFSGLAVADGQIFAVDHDSNVYCFGLANRGSGSLVSALPRAAAPFIVDEQAVHDKQRRAWTTGAGVSLVLMLAAAITGSWAGMKQARDRGTDEDLYEPRDLVR